MLSAITFLVALLASLPLADAASAAPAAASIRGRIAPAAEDRPLQLVTAGGRAFDLIVDESLQRTMRDPQLAERTWEALGRETADGRFEVDRAFTVKNGRRHRVTYYCEICHITTHEPGRCMCCQEETELREIPEK